MDAELIQLVATQLVKELQNPHTSEQQQHEQRGPARAWRRPIGHRPPFRMSSPDAARRATIPDVQPAWLPQTVSQPAPNSPHEASAVSAAEQHPPIK
jgi:hypothetical protein